ncbi:hypothetical protein ACOMHN_022537 [Nucella lapillus]
MADPMDVKGKRGRVKRDTQQGRVDLEAKALARELNSESIREEVETNLTNARPEVESAVNEYNFSVHEDFDDRASAFSKQIGDVCLAEHLGDPLCGSLYTCRQGTCQYKCEGHYCSEHGICYVHDFNGSTAATCNCQSDDVYDYSGEACEEGTMKVEWVAGITAGVSGVLVVVFLVIIGCLCRPACRRYRRQKKALMDDSFALESRGATEEITPGQMMYRRNVMAPRHTTTYACDNRAYEPTSPMDFYMTTAPEPAHQSSVLRFYESPQNLSARATTTDRHDPSSKEMSAGGASSDRVDHDTQFRIQRPKVSTRPLTDN